MPCNERKKSKPSRHIVSALAVVPDCDRCPEKDRLKSLCARLEILPTLVKSLNYGLLLDGALILMPTHRHSRITWSRRNSRTFSVRSQFVLSSIKAINDNLQY